MMVVIIFHLRKSVAKISFYYVTNQCENGHLLSMAMNHVERFVLILNKDLTVHLSAAGS